MDSETPVFMTGDGTDDTIVDEALFTCSTAASLYGGSGGSMIHVFANGTESSFLVQGYETARWADRLIVLLRATASAAASPASLRP